MRGTHVILSWSFYKMKYMITLRIHCFQNGVRANAANIKLAIHNITQPLWYSCCTNALLTVHMKVYIEFLTLSTSYICHSVFGISSLLFNTASFFAMYLSIMPDNGQWPLCMYIGTVQWMDVHTNKLLHENWSSRVTFCLTFKRDHWLHTAI